VASLQLNAVTIDFPLYSSQRNLRAKLFQGPIGGLISRAQPASNRVTVRALENISLDLKSGDRVALVGHNGAGKSTLLRVMAGVYAPTEGRVSISGRIAPLFDKMPGFDPDDTGLDSIITCGLLLGMKRQEIDDKLPSIAEFSELGEYLALPLNTYSTGMVTRLGFAIATSLDPDILLLDEAVGTGDARFAEKARNRVASLVDRSQILVFASHSEELVRAMCNKAVLLAAGRIVQSGTIDEIFQAYHRARA
jgi:ABC-type polysaccharide/polyol phosphate transport system ATPase subunit